MSDHRKKILVFSDWYLPGYKAGGPIRSLANLVDAVDQEFYIVSSNTDHHSTERYPGIKPDCWIDLNFRTHVYYCSRGKGGSSLFEKLIREINPDKIYFNSLFSPVFTLTPLRVARKLKLQKKCIVAPRGMLKSGALSIKSKKKKFFLFTAKLIGLYSDITWHATNPDEVQEIKNHFSSAAKVHLSVNLPSRALQQVEKPEKLPGELKLICIARISKEKGIVETLNYIKSANLKGKVSCDFYGTEQDKNYLDFCLSVAGSIPDAEIHFRGEIDPSRIAEVMADKHFFIMCTWGENFGHAIAEALNLSTPVIISDKTPWKGLQAKNAGWALPHDESGFAQVLNHCLDMGDEEYRNMSKAAFELGMEVSHDPQAVRQAEQLFG